MRYFLSIIAVVFFYQNTHAQNITIKADTISFDELILKLKNQSDCTFFYYPEWADSIFFKVNFDKEPLDSVIHWVCINSALSYNVINQNKVVFLKDYKIRTNYSDVYADYLENKSALLDDSIIYYLPKQKEKEENQINKEYLLHTIGNQASGARLKNATLSGKIIDEETGEPLVGVTVYIDELKNGSLSNTYGNYTMSMPKGRYRIEYRMVGMKTTYRNIDVLSDGKLDIEMKSKPTSLKEVVVTAKNDDRVKNLMMGTERITMKTLKQLPLGMGEPDVIKSTLLLPGVQSVGEASSGFNVRGGSIDQNLILLNDAPIINTSHFFGFFSGFNSEVIKDITLFKSGIPAKYGGRVSSVMDITMKEGNRKNMKLNGGISPVSGRLTIESPIIKDKCSFILGTRVTYSDWALKLINDSKLKRSRANFYDLQGSFSYDIDKNNSIYLSGYYSYDEFDYYSEDAFKYTTSASTIKWKKIFNPKLFSTFSGVISNYEYTNELRTDSSNLHSIEYKISQYSFKSDFYYHTGFDHKLNFGFNTTWYDLLPGIRKPINQESLIAPMEIEKEFALENALYLSDEFDLNDFISVSVGLRYSFYSSFGPKTKFIYRNGYPRSVESITDTVFYEKRVQISNYSGPEFRFSSNIRLGNSSSLKIGVSRAFQYIQMISNTASMSPTDIWKLCDSYLKPQKADQYSLGFYSKFKQNIFETSIEVYYKNLENVLDYKGGAELVMNEHLETDVLNGTGKAYGVEFMVEKKVGKLSGWVNYTYSRVFHKINSTFEEEKVNRGDYFPANYDKPHDFKFVVNYKLSRRFNVSSNFFYSTGRPFTAPVSYYDFAGATRVYYTERNSVRMPDYIRLDLAATINGNLIAKKLNHSSWTFAIYNVLGRRNAYNIFFRTEGEKVNGYKMSIFGQPIFTVTYNFKIFGNAKDDF